MTVGHLERQGDESAGRHEEPTLEQVEEQQLELLRSGGMETEQGRFFLLNGLKFRLRAIINTLLDIKIHTEDMTRDEAMELMMQGGCFH